MDSYVFEPPLQARPYAVAAVLDLVGVAVLVFGIERGSLVLGLIGVLVFVLGLVIAASALVVRQKVRSQVLLNDDGVVVRSGGRQASVRWQEISGVSTDRQTLYLERSEDLPALKISSPRGPGDPRLTVLSDELSRRLDRSRGYRPF